MEENNSKLHHVVTVCKLLEETLHVPNHRVAQLRAQQQLQPQACTKAAGSQALTMRSRGTNPAPAVVKSHTWSTAKYSLN